MLYEFIRTASEYARAIFPWLILGSFLSYFVEEQVKPASIKKYFNSFSYPKLFAAEMLGMISPLSILSFIPVAGELVSKGANPGLLFSFFIAERAYDLQAFFIVTSLFGLKMATLNALIIFMSLVATAIYLKQQQFHLVTKVGKTSKSSFWQRQLKLVFTVVMGIVIGALLKTLIPTEVFKVVAGSYLGGTISALILGFSLYFGPLMGNYPVAKAFSDLGMSSIGILTFLSVSPIFNLVIIMIFSSIAGLKRTVPPIGIYTVTSLILSVLFGSFL